MTGKLSQKILESKSQFRAAMTSAQIWYRAALLGECVPPLKDFRSAFPKAEFIYEGPRKRVTLPPRQVDFFSRARHLDKPTYVVPQNFLAFTSNAFFCPRNNAILNAHGQFVEESVNTITSFPKNYIRIARRDLAEASPYLFPATPLLGKFNNHYHFLLDVIPRLFSLHHPALRSVPEIHMLHARRLTDLQLELIARVAPPNAKVKRVSKNGLHKLSHLVFAPFRTRDFAGYMPSDVVVAFGKTLLPDNCCSSPTRRVFVSRNGKGIEKRRVLNEDEVMLQLSKLGFCRIDPAEHSFESQVRIFSSARVIVGAHGAGLANMVFSKHASVIEIGASDELIPHYWFLAQSLGHRHQFVPGTSKNGDASTVVDVGRLVEVVAQQCHELPSL